MGLETKYDAMGWAPCPAGMSSGSECASHRARSAALGPMSRRRGGSESALELKDLIRKRQSRRQTVFITSHVLSD